MRQRTLLTLAAVAGLGAILVTSSRARRVSAELDGQDTLAAAMMPGNGVDAQTLMAAADAVKRTGGDPELASAIEDTARSAAAQSALPFANMPVTCATWSSCTLYEQPDVVAAAIPGVDIATLRAVHRTADGWTRVLAKRLGAPAVPGIVIDPNIPAANEVIGWIPTMNLIDGTNPNAALRDVGTPQSFMTIGRASEVQFGDTRELGRWITSPFGQLVIATALGAASALIPGAWLAIPLFAFIRSAVELAVEALIQAFGRVLQNERFDRAILGALMYQFGQAANAVLDNPKLLEKAGFKLPVDLKEIGTIKSLAIRYLTSSFANVADFISNPIYVPTIQEAMRVAARESIDIDAALERARFTPTQISAKNTLLVVDRGRPILVPLREDAIALGLNAQLGRILYPPEWFRPSDGKMVTDPAEIRRLAQWEYGRAAASKDQGEKIRAYERVKILNRQLNRVSNAGKWVQRDKKLARKAEPTDRTGPDDIVWTSARLLDAYNSAVVRGQPAKIIRNLRVAYEKRLADESSQQQAVAESTAAEARKADAERKAREAEGARRLVRPEAIFDPGQALGALPRDLKASAPSRALTIAAVTSPLWASALLLRRSS